jgi:dihydroxyacetone kinase
MQRLGGAQRGDKTMLDALLPFTDALQGAVEGGSDLAQAWQEALAVAEQAAQDTAQLRPKVGRARPLAERSVGTPDAGAVSLALALRTASAALGGQDSGTSGVAQQ